MEVCIFILYFTYLVIQTVSGIPISNDQRSISSIPLSLLYLITSFKNMTENAVAILITAQRQTIVN